MKETFLKRLASWLLRNIYLQLYLSLIASPILLYWGLPLSVASPLGNILFNPLLTLFLFLSSLLFFTELLHLPNSILIWLLDKSTLIFDSLAHAGRQYWLVGFARPSFFVLWLIPLATLCIVHYRHSRKSFRGIILLSSLSFMVSMYLIYAQQAAPVQTISCNNGFITILHTDKSTIVIDPGVLGARISATSFIQYTLVPSLIKTTGTMTIDVLILTKCNQMTLIAAQKLAELVTIKAIYMPAWSGNLGPEQQQAFTDCIEKLKSSTIFYSIVGPLQLIISHGNVTITPRSCNFNYKGLHYPSLTIEGTIQGKEFTVSNSKSRTSRIAKNGRDTQQIREKIPAKTIAI